MQFNDCPTQHNGNTKHMQSTVSLDGLHEFMNGNTTSTNHKHKLSEGNISSSVSLSERQTDWEKRWDSVREFIYREAFIVGVDEFSLKLFSFVFSTFNLYYWLTIFYFPNCVI